MGSSQRRRRRSGSSRATSAGAPPPQKGPGLRGQLESYGGMWMLAILGVVVVVVVIAVVSVQRSGTDASDDPLLGEAITIGEARHTADITEMEIVDGRPPVGGPHFAQPQRTGIYDEAPSDGFLVHSLEHGIVWFSYNPDLVSEADLSTLEDIADDFRNDVILSPRRANAMAIAAASWGRLLSLDALDEELLRDFVTTNRDRSPEPGIR
ncbi:MAG: DUF3105 domain-containing protein [Chloroflexi bacterium]|nr:DUF3105 domain-containing protein [Chloroflexota bacterium]